MTQETPDLRTENPDAARLPHPDAGAPTRPPGRFARWIARGRTRFRRHVPPGWNWRRVVAGVVLGEVAIVLILLLFLALSGKELVVSFEHRNVIPPAGPSPRLTIPVAGVLATELKASYGAPRTPTRKHRGIDIRAPRG
ncbi:MAG: hypothetical protein GWN71_38635, partial [Gammaproteobacteria bacterium]|nr:hypothetical protein [Gemmatimonadota bacterium]NIU79257.1 hypothetical protein [Gammaproteobacteria bacterium]NIY12300.1 hypothetical protein [Gemmatimonadota bacterium]